MDEEKKPQGDFYTKEEMVQFKKRAKGNKTKKRRIRKPTIAEQVSRISVPPLYLQFSPQSALVLIFFLLSLLPSRSSIPSSFPSPSRFLFFSHPPPQLVPLEDIDHDEHLGSRTLREERKREIRIEEIVNDLEKRQNYDLAIDKASEQSKWFFEEDNEGL
jgi:hypothetical protein